MSTSFVSFPLFVCFFSMALFPTQCQAELTEYSEWMARSHSHRTMQRMSDLLALGNNINIKHSKNEVIVNDIANKKTLNSVSFDRFKISLQTDDKELNERTDMSSRLPYRKQIQKPSHPHYGFVFAEYAATLAMCDPENIRSVTDIIRKKIAPNAEMAMLIVVLDNHCRKNGWYGVLHNFLTEKQRSALKAVEDPSRIRVPLEEEFNRLENLFTPYLPSHAIDKALAYILLSRSYNEELKYGSAIDVASKLLLHSRCRFHLLRWYTLADVPVNDKKMNDISAYAFDEIREWPVIGAAVVLRGMKGCSADFYSERNRKNLCEKVRISTNDGRAARQFLEMLDWSKALFLAREGVHPLLKDSLAKDGSRYASELGALFYPNVYFRSLMRAFKANFADYPPGKFQNSFKITIQQLSKQNYITDDIVYNLYNTLLDVRRDYTKSIVLLTAITSINDVELAFSAIYRYFKLEKNNFSLDYINKKNAVSSGLFFFDNMARRNGVDAVDFVEDKRMRAKNNERRQILNQMGNFIERIREDRGSGGNKPH